MNGSNKLLFISFSRVLIGIFPFLGSLYIGRILNEEQFGSYYLFYLLSTFLLTFFAFNVHIGYRRHTSSKSYKVKYLGFLSSQIYLSYIFLINILLTVLFYFSLSGFHNLSPEYLFFLILFCYTSVFLSMYESFSIVTESVKVFITNIIIPILLAWAVSLFIVEQSKDWIDRYKYFSFTILAFSYISLLFSKDIFQLTRRQRAYVLLIGKKYFRISLHLVLPVLAIQGFNYFDKLVLKNYLDELSFGQFSLALQLSLIPFMAFKVLELLYEKSLFSNPNANQKKTKFIWHLNIYIASQIIFSIFLMLFMPIFFSILYSKTLILDSYSVFLLSLLQLSKLSFSFLIIYLLLFKEQSKAINNCFILLVLWGISIYLSSSVIQYMIFTVLSTYASVIIVMMYSMKKRKNEGNSETLKKQ